MVHERADQIKRGEAHCALCRERVAVTVAVAPVDRGDGMAVIHMLSVCEQCNTSPDLWERFAAEVARADAAKDIPVFDATDWDG